MKNKIATVLFLSFCIISMQAAEGLKLNLEKDKTYSILSVSENTISNNINGMQMDITNNSVNKISFKAVGNEGENLLLKVTFDSVVNEMNMPGRSIKTSSVKPGDPKKADEFMNTAFYILSKNPLDVKMTPSGKIIEIPNAKAVISEIGKSLDSLPQGTQMQMKPMLEMILNEASLRSMIETITYYFPQNNETDKWTNKLTVTAQGMTLVVNSNFKVNGVNGNEMNINGESTIEPGGNGMMKMNGMDIVFDMRGMGNGEMTVDAATGWIIKGKSKQKMKGSITFNGMTNPMEIETKAEYKKVN